MSLSDPFILRPVGTTLMTIGIALAGVVAFFKLPVSPLPQIDFPAISVSASMPGASPETMASSVATPLEAHLGQIADVSEITSQSSVGTTNITLQFGLNRDIDGAARDVQAAINAARADLPTALRSNPTYRKVNPADAPIMVLAMTSSTLSAGQLYDSGSTVIQQKLSQVEGVGQVNLGGSSLPAVRVELNPKALFKYGIGLEDVRAALSAANANSPKGAIESDKLHWQLYSNDQARTAADYKTLIVAYRSGAAVRLTDIADVLDSVENVRNMGLANGQSAVLVTVFRQPGANIIKTIDHVLSLLPELRASIPGAAEITLVMDRSTTIRASLHDVEITLMISIGLVILVVFIFLRSIRATLIPSVVVPVSLLGTFGVMYMLDYSLDNLSLMALTVATGFVVDDAIVVIENIMRHIETGMPRFEAAVQGVREVGFTVVTMSISLIAVFIPILLMGDIVGRLFREFAIVLSVAILVSMVVSLTTTPMMCSRVLKIEQGAQMSRFHRRTENFFSWLLNGYEHSLAWALRYKPLMIFILVGMVALNVVLFRQIPKGFFPEQDTGRIMGGVIADQSISFQSMSEKFRALMEIIRKDPAIESVAGWVGSGGFSGGSNTGRMFIALKPLGQRKETAQQAIARLRPQLARIPGAQMYLAPVQDIRSGARGGNALYQYTLQADELDLLRTWTPRLMEALRGEAAITDLNSDQSDKGLETDLVIDRDEASRLGLTASQIDATLYDAFGQRQVSTIYHALNQYHVVMEVAPQYWQDPNSLSQIYVSSSGGSVGGTQSTNAVSGTVSALAARSGSSSASSSVASDPARNSRLNAIASTGKGSASTGQAVSTSAASMIPLAAFSHYETGTSPVEVNHQGQFAAATVSFNLIEGKSLSDAVDAVNRQTANIHMPTAIRGSFQGTAKSFQQSNKNQILLIIAAIVAIYVVLGILYESYAHPLTILSTLPSGGLGAVLSLMLFNKDFSLIALIGVFLLIGIVKKNAIMMIDFALVAERVDGLSPRDAIFKASLLRFRPILMTTIAALLGALPLAIGSGNGAELRQPLGISIVGGLIVSQLLTLYTTPVVYLYIDQIALWSARRRSSQKKYSPVPA